MKVTRKRIRVLIFAAVVAAAAVPLGFALSLESQSNVVVAERATPLAMTVAAPVSSVQLIHDLPEVSDAAKLFGMGAVLLGLASAVRRAA